jgi:hypothetical protein
MELKKLLKFISCNETVKNFSIKEKEIIVKDDSSSIAIYIKLKEKLFKNDFALLDIGKMLKIISEGNLDKYEEMDDALLFKGKRIKYKKMKAEEGVIPKVKSSKDQIKKLFNDNQIKIELNSENMENMNKILKLGVGEIIKFYTEKGNLIISSGFESQEKLEGLLCKTDKEINNCYEAKYLISLLSTIKENSEMILGYDKKEKEALPLIIEFNEEEDNLFYILVPVEDK